MCSLVGGMRQGATGNRRWSCLGGRTCLSLVLAFLVVRVLVKTHPVDRGVPDACQRLIDIKQEFADLSKDGVRPSPNCSTISRAPALKNRERPINEYEIEEFIHQSTLYLSPNSVTVAVQLSLDRLTHLEKLGNSWTGRVSASIFIPHPRHTPDAEECLRNIADFHANVEKHKQYSLDIGVVFALDGTDKLGPSLTRLREDRPVEEQYHYMYPVNVGRNVALGQVQTDLTLVVDADFVFSQGAYEAAHGGNTHWNNVLCAVRERAQRGLGTFAVIPAFELGKDHPIPTIKSSLVRDYQEGNVQRMGGNIITHCPTDFYRWMTSQVDYVIQWGPFFEPYGVAATEMIPWYPEEFKGYHLNKIMEYFKMAAYGWEFIVLPEHFVLHLWHPTSQSRNIILNSPQLMKLIHNLRDRYAMRLGTEQNICDPELLNSNILLPVASMESPRITQKTQSPDGIHTFLETDCKYLSGLY